MKKQLWIACTVLALAALLPLQDANAQKTAPAKATNGKGGQEKPTEGARVMTHEEIEKMMADKALVMEAMRRKPAPAFTAKDLNGKTYTLAELKGKTVVLNFWFVGCKPCIMEMPHLNNLVEKYKGEDVVFLAFALDSEPALQKFLAKTPFYFNIIPDAGDLAKDTYKINSYPTSIVIDRQGIVQDYLLGYSEDVEEKLMAFIDKALAAE